jgi:hypothetical protein
MTPAPITRTCIAPFVLLFPGCRAPRARLMTI